MKTVRVGILGATGIVGQQYLQLLAGHPWFEIVFLAASPRSAGKSYAEAVQGRWHASSPLSKTLGKMPVHSTDAVEKAREQCSLVFSALSGPEVGVIEERYAAAGLAVISNASAHRMTPDVPLLLPEVNAEHSKVIPLQRKNRGWDTGFIAVKPNCSIQSYMAPLHALHSHFPLKNIVVTTLQAVSGAGHPGVASLDILDNIIPFIAGEEQKSEKEPLKLWGKIKENAIEAAASPLISAHCNRVPVLDGHLACVSVQFQEKPPSFDHIRQLWQDYRGLPQEIALPSAPKQPIHYFEEVDRPQPKKDRLLEKGMAVSVGRLRTCPVLDLRFVGLSHNTVRGAAGGGVLIAEMLVQQSYVSLSTFSQEALHGSS